MHQGGNLASALAEASLKCSGYGKTHAIFYQLAMVFRDCSGSRGRNAYACGPVHSLADRGSGSKINWPFPLKACGRQRERERGREKKKEVEGRGEKKEKEGGKESGAERVDIHLSDTTSVYVFRMEKLGRHRRRSAVSVETPAMPGVQDGRV